MAIRVELDKDMLRRAIEMASASAQRQLNSKTLNPKFKAIHEEDVRLYNIALGSMSEVK